MRESIVIQHTKKLSAAETQSQRAHFESEGWSAVIVKQRPDLAGSGWKAYEWSGVKENRITLEGISVPSLDVNADELHAALAKDYELENFEILDWTAPVPNEDGYLIHTVTIRSTTP